MHTTAILGRTSAFTGNTARVFAVELGRLEALVHEDVLPVVAEVVRVQLTRSVSEGWLGVWDELRNWIVTAA